MKPAKLIVFGVVFLLAISILAFGCGEGEEPAGDDVEEDVEEAEDEVDFPTSEITYIVPYAPGGASSLSAEPIAEEMSEILGEPVTVVNREGGGGSVGTAEVATEQPDGYTILNASSGPATIRPHMSETGYELDSFEPVAQLTDMPNALTVSADSDFEDLDDFVEYAQDNPGELNYGTPGAGNSQHLAAESFQLDYDFDMTQITYEGSSPAVAELMGGHIDATVTSITEVAPYYEDGEVEILAIMGEERVDFLDDVPTFEEEGYDVHSGVWFGVLAPAGTPDDVIDILSGSIEDALETDAVQEAYDELDLIASYLPPDEFGQRIEDESEMNREIIEEIGLEEDDL
ncbi:tripartite tricarboxylate transporter substrate binding protein [Natranaerofaba carboxydovora]|uniref:tripartite tricarboxylate transporter substrate binding protein n=1 Tax=Natranaerofaba carboxydovora TaxID=2742683 RepID=UPI001F12F206|nr:tripartite tricarboxylate transporter substrate binding protein [Natranaerofaba carboxydovora]UMZ74288.1 Tripartite tricarboxylate transporter family receptor [Natranaerofaba carboxydovora]